MILNRTVFLLGSALLLLIAGSPSAWATDDVRGQQLYALCAQCHGANGGGNEVYLAPAIAGMDQWYIEGQLKMFKSGARGTHPEDVGGMRMHPMSRWLKNDQDIAAVAGYVSNMQATRPSPTLAGGNAEIGKTYYQTCASCHGPEGQGNEAMNAPSLANASDWYLVSALQKYKAGIRGGNPANANATVMRGMSNLLPNQQAIVDVVTYIDTLNNQDSGRFGSDDEPNG